MDIKDKKMLIIGLGVSGYASARFLAEKGAMVKVTDNATTAGVKEYAKMLEGYPVRIETGGHTKDFCADAEVIVTSPGVDMNARDIMDALPEGVPVMGELELAFMFSRAPVIAITGTNGKSTTTELIGRILSLSGRHAVVCGNIGSPFISKADELGDESVAIVEVSSFQLETIKKFRPKIAVLLNIAEDHYDRHRGYDNYKREKFKIFMNQEKNDWAVIHSDLEGDKLLKGLKSRLVFFGNDTGMIEEVMKTPEAPLKGRHNLDNILAAITVSRIMGVGENIIKNGIKTFSGLKHRFESIGIRDGVEYIDDSKATNIDATRQALESLTKKAVLIAGGRDKGGDYSSILPLVKEKVKLMVVMGESRQKIETVFRQAVPVIVTDTMKESVKAAASRADKGEVVLLSPMCSSFDMFTDYKERGKVFREEVGM